MVYPENIDSGHSNFKLDDRSGRRYHNVAHLHIHARSPNPTLRAGPIQKVPLPDVSLLDRSVSDGEQLTAPRWLRLDPRVLAAETNQGRVLHKLDAFSPCACSSGVLSPSPP